MAKGKKRDVSSEEEEMSLESESDEELVSYESDEEEELSSPSSASEKEEDSSVPTEQKVLPSTRSGRARKSIVHFLHTQTLDKDEREENLDDVIEIGVASRTDIDHDKLGPFLTKLNTFGSDALFTLSDPFGDSLKLVRQGMGKSDPRAAANFDLIAHSTIDRGMRAPTDEEKCMITRGAPVDQPCELCFCPRTVPTKYLIAGGKYMWAGSACIKVGDTLAAFYNHLHHCMCLWKQDRDLVDLPNEMGVLRKLEQDVTTAHAAKTNSAAHGDFSVQPKKKLKRRRFSAVDDERKGHEEDSD